MIDNSIPHALEVQRINLATELVVEGLRPSSMYRPRLSIDGDQWCALYGKNIQDGVCGFGDSPDAAYKAFDKAWYESLKKKHNASQR